MKLAISKIKIAKRLREVKPAYLRPIQNGMANDGLLEPILVFKNAKGQHQLVDGLHRLTAAKNLKWKTIEVVVLEFPAEWSQDRIDLQVRLIEVDSHLGIYETPPPGQYYIPRKRTAAERAEIQKRERANLKAEREATREWRAKEAEKR